ncbi:MAG: hypothetical protein U0350_16375 [Caldilineaceae bacterium]
MHIKLKTVFYGKIVFLLIMVALLNALTASGANAQANTPDILPTSDGGIRNAERHTNQPDVELVTWMRPSDKTSWLRPSNRMNLVSSSVQSCGLPDCIWLSAVSEETSVPTFCPRGYAVDGMACSGSYCDNVALHCRRYTSTPDSSRLYDSVSYWISEEHPNNMYPPQNQQWSPNWFVVGLKCKGRYCDDIQLFIKKNNSQLANSGICWFSNSWFSEENDPFKQQKSEDQSFDAHTFVAGLQCKGRYCDNMSLYYCVAK